jgi:hypothetical protein
MYFTNTQAKGRTEKRFSVRKKLPRKCGFCFLKCCGAESTRRELFGLLPEM